MYSDFQRDNQITQRFEHRLTAYKIFNIILILWILTQIGLYSYQISISPCQQVTNMGIGYLINYILYFFVPILVILCIIGKQILLFTIIYCGVNIVVKIVVIIVLLTLGWRHVGQCYISDSVKGTIIANCVAELLTLMIQIWLLNRRRQVNILKEKLGAAINTTNYTVKGNNDIYTP